MSGFSNGLPVADMEFLRDMTKAVIEASRVPPGSNGGGTWAISNSAGFALITPGKDTYPSYWIRDFSMAIDSGLIEADEIRHHLILTCRMQNGPTERTLDHGLRIPPWAIPDHISYDGRPTFFPGTYATGEDQGKGAFGRLPPIDDHYEFVHMAHVYWKLTGDMSLLAKEVDGMAIFERLKRAFSSPSSDTVTGLSETTEADRAVGFGFCDGNTHTGKLLFASLLRYRAAGEMAEMADALGDRSSADTYRSLADRIRKNIVPAFGDSPAIGGWLYASTGIGRQVDVWGTLFAVHLGVLGQAAADAARQSIAEAVRQGAISHEGGVRQVPTTMDFSDTTAWERSLWKVNTYQNGGYWHTATGWLVAALWKSDRPLATRIFGEMIRHLRSQDFRQGPGYGAPWEVYGMNGKNRVNAVYLASVALPYSVLKNL